MNDQFFLSVQFCLHNGVLVLQQDDSQVTIGIKDFNNEELKDRISRAVKGACNKICIFMEISEDEFSRNSTSIFEKKSIQKKENQEQKKNTYDENAAKALLDSLMQRARDIGATDIHLEIDSVRFRVAGSLVSGISLDEKNMGYLIQRIKMLSKMNLVEYRKGQDGQFVYETYNGNIFVRVSCIPVVGLNGTGVAESVVLRLLDPGRISLKLDSLGFNLMQLSLLKKSCTYDNGLIIVSGPTGAGKSTTASAMLEEISTNSCMKKKIVSLEDPPEYILKGVTQIQMEGQQEMDFSESLKRVFRHDPDVIMIGEIRDKETASVAIQASLTGHLVIATLHAGSVEQVIIRLCNLGIEKNVLGEVLKTVVIQHLTPAGLEASVVDFFAEMKELENVQ